MVDIGGLHRLLKRSDVLGISESFNHVVEWKSKRWQDKRGVRKICPSLRATDYKCPKYVWYACETE